MKSCYIIFHHYHNRVIQFLIIKDVDRILNLFKKIKYVFDRSVNRLQQQTNYKHCLEKYHDLLLKKHVETKIDVVNSFCFNINSRGY